MTREIIGAVVLIAAVAAYLWWWAHYWLPWADEVVNRAFGV